MIFILICSFSFVRNRCAPKGVGRKFFGRKGAKESPKPRNSTNKPLSILSMTG